MYVLDHLLYVINGLKRKNKEEKEGKYKYNLRVTEICESSKLFVIYPSYFERQLAL